MTISAIQIGLDSEVIDYGSPDFARFPGLNADKLRAANDQNIEQLRFSAPGDQRPEPP